MVVLVLGYAGMGMFMILRFLRKFWKRVDTENKSGCIQLKFQLSPEHTLFHLARIELEGKLVNSGKVGSKSSNRLINKERKL